MSDRRESWYDDKAGPMVRPYAVTRGRTRSNRPDLDMITLVIAIHPDNGVLDREYAEILRLCQRPLSVAEISAQLDMALAVVKILIGDLIEQGYLLFRAPPTAVDNPDMDILQAVLDGIRRL
ncbi:MAG TPA: DUF742 domain-containing protein [Pseudonocardiaceae bacterium]|nr:DUF742 domain-containing protein [Pseudonocardiaceae bacterium]